MATWLPPASILLALLLLAAYAGALALLWHVEGRERWRAALTERFVLGVPWGTLVVCTLVLGVYLLVQGGLRHWNAPVVVAFRSWSYLYPTGVVFSSLAHNSPTHLIGNLAATLVLGPIAEFAWSHYPRSAADSHRLDEFDSDATPDGRTARLRSTARRWLRRPGFRALVAFPAIVLAIGLFTSLFFLGPVVGFSGVVFALGGFALVHYPVATVVALLLTGVVRTTYNALQSPVVVRGISGGAPSRPWWAEVAVQAHAVGVLVGVVLGLAVLLARDERPRAGAIFLATLVYGVTRNLWAVYWIGDGGQYVLYRGLGIVLVVLLAVLVTVASTASDRPITSPLAGLPWRISGRSVALGWLLALALALAGVVALALSDGWPLLPTVGAAAALTLALATPAVVVLFPGDDSAEAPTARQSAFAALVLATGLLGGVAVYPNLVTVGDDAVPGTGSVTVEDYAVTYEEGVENRLIPVVPIPGVEERTRTRTSGTVVVSTERHAWWTAQSRQYVASEGGGTVVLGGLGWRESVRVERSGWSVVGNGSVYVVDVEADDQRVRSFESEPRRAEPRVAGHNLTVLPTEDGFDVRATRGGEVLDRVAIPEPGESVELGDLEVRTETRSGRPTLLAVQDGTEVRIATRERYRNR